MQNSLGFFLSPSMLLLTSKNGTLRALVYCAPDWCCPILLFYLFSLSLTVLDHDVIFGR
jgi:hypothetical protein